MNEVKNKARFYGVGVGPGDPELMTIKALKILKNAPVIAVPSSGKEGEGRAERIVREALGDEEFETKKIMRLRFPMTNKEVELEFARTEAAFKISRTLTDGADVAFVTLGDPLFYSTFSYMVPYLKESRPGLQIEICPGVTSASASASALGLSLAENSESVAIIPAVHGMDEVRDALSKFDTVVLMKVKSVVDEVLDLLEELKLTDSAAFVSRATWPDAEIATDVRTLRGTKPDYFSMMIIKGGGRKKESTDA
ncbi:MAG: precorrin-2 C(20)-methyltransferase [Thermodesulfobacteriota bacterium]